MPRVNLLPWREAERKRKRQEFMVGVVGALIVGGVIGLLAQFQMQRAIDHQKARNQVVIDQTKAVDKEITEILGLEQQKQRLLARMEVIEQLQRSRPGVVHLFDQLVRTIPDGVYYGDIKQTAGKIQINGKAQSSTRVSALMRNIEASEWLADPALSKVETKGSGDAASDFAMSANLTAANEPVATKPKATAKKPARRAKK